eukprot:gene12126-13378_t
MNTADLCDAFGDELLYVNTVELRDFGGKRKFEGCIATVKCFDDNSKVKEAVNEPGNGKVLVVDGSGSLKRSLLGDNLAASAIKNGWSGIVINGCIRDSEVIGTMNLGVKAMGAIPRKTEKKGLGTRDEAVEFCEVTFQPGHYLYADSDGIVIAKQKLTMPKL